MKADVKPKPVISGEVETGGILLAVENVSLSFGGVKAIRGVSFDIRKGEIRAIIGPNGAGKTSMLNVINGFYHPQEGTITYKGKRRHDMRPYLAARGGIARTFQNVALFKGMSTLDNIMTGRTLKMRRGLLAHALHFGPARWEEVRHREAVERIIDFLEIAHIRKRAPSPTRACGAARCGRTRRPSRASAAPSRTSRCSAACRPSTTS